MVNQSIRRVLLLENKITDEGAQQLIEALKWNHGIEYFVIRGDPISKHVEAEIEDILNDPKRKVRRAQMKHVRAEIERKDEAMKHVREEITMLKTALATKDQQLASIKAQKSAAEAKLKSIQDEKEAAETSLNDTRDVKIKQEDNVETPEMKKQKTEEA